MSGRVIIVGGGLAGLSAAHTVLENGCRVLVLDKNSFLGGNSTKATSGINGALTKTQIQLGIQDSVESFYQDTALSARTQVRPDLVRVLTGKSGEAVEWLQNKFSLDLSLVSRLGGHSYPRTHRGKERFPGMTITYALMERLEQISESTPHLASFITKARVTRLITQQKQQQQQPVVIGVEYERAGKLYQEYGPVIIATGGYAADFTSNSLLKQYRSDIYHLPTTNGDHCTGDGIKIATPIGASTVDMENVQVHPTGLVDPKEPDAKVKFLAAEALRGVGGLLLDNQAQRFCDELGHRDYVTGEMWKNAKPPHRLVLNSQGAKEIEWHCKHYVGRGLMKHFKSGAELAAEIGVPTRVLEQTFNQYNEIAEKKNDPFGKKFFQNLPFKLEDEFYVSIVCPVLHYCMGGLEINADAAVIGNNAPIPGLWATGEVCGGVHGANRLGGNSLLDCVVFGRVSGVSAAKYLLSQADSVTRVDTLTQHLSNGIRITVEPDQKRILLDISFNNNERSLQPGAPTSTQTQTDSSREVPNEKTTSDSNKKEWTLDEVAKHNKEDDCWVVVNGQVLNVTNFLDDHPGGKKAILLYAGKDASEEFNMLHKPEVIQKYAPDAVIGALKSGGSSSEQSPEPTPTPTPTPAPAPIPKKDVQLVPSNVESELSGGTADVLPTERAKATFSSEKLTNFLDGGPEKTKRKRFIISPLKNADASEQHNWDREQHLKEHVKHFITVHQTFWDNFIPTREEVSWMTENSMIPGSLTNHYGLFLPTIDVQASAQQKQWWLARAMRMKIIGCYAQTELGHGSNVRGIQTVAEYDKSTQEFVLNTPTLRSMKWWPGALGKVSTHALVYAQLIIEGKEYGVHTFMVQIRDENHNPLPGIEVGDLGPKLGDHSNDTGFLKLKNVRIPREFMLARFQEVTPDGQYVRSESVAKNAPVHYATMMFTRGSMVKGAGVKLSRAVTIATRYSCVRTQGFIDTKKGASYRSPEKQIIDYSIQRYRIFKQLALAYAIRFSGSWMISRFKALEQGGDRLGNLEEITEIAATSSGLKALCTFLAWQGIEDCRKCCGGNGYLLSSGIATLSADYVWQTTAEGDWIILTLQTGRFLLKSLQDALAGKTVSGPMAYLKPLSDPSLASDPSKFAPKQATSYEQFYDVHYLLTLFNHTALMSVVFVGQLFQQKLADANGDFDVALNAIAIELSNCVRTHSLAFILSNFVSAVSQATEQDKSIGEVLSQLAAVFAISVILDDPEWSGKVTSEQLQLARKALGNLLDKLRPNAIALVDAFDLPDNVLNSTIGRQDGNVYEALVRASVNTSLNRKDPFDGYEYLSPHLDKDFLKRGNVLPPTDSKI